MKKLENNLFIRSAIPEDSSTIHKTMEEVYNSLEDKSVYIKRDKEDIESRGRTKGYGVVTCDKNKNNKIVGFMLFRAPDKDEEDNLGRDLGLSYEDLDKVLYIESVAVLPEYRGNGILRKMISYGEEMTRESKFKYLVATVAPSNIPSKKSFLNAGYREEMMKRKRNGLLRSILLKERKITREKRK